MMKQVHIHQNNFFYANIILDMLNVTFFYLKHEAKEKYNSYNYVKINGVFTPNSRGLWYQFESPMPADRVL